MRIIDADKFLEDMKSTDRYFMVKFDIERAPTVDLWHYPSKGESPEKRGYYYCCLTTGYHNEKYYEVVLWSGEHWVTYDYEQVIAWQDIIPPKEEV